MKIINLGVLFAFLTSALVFANTEADLEQPVKLLGGTLKKPEKCTKTVSPNSRITLHYRARAWGNPEFYEDTYITEPHNYKLGRDKLLKGLEQGIQGMCLGEVRRLLIPADLAYGQLGVPNLVPENTAVIYEVEMIDIDSPTRNPWFWVGLVALVGGFYAQSKFTNMSESSSSAKFLEQKEKEQAKKTN